MVVMVFLPVDANAFVGLLVLLVVDVGRLVGFSLVELSDRWVRSAPFCVLLD